MSAKLLDDDCACKRYSFIPSERNRIPAPLPFIIREDDLPKNQKILVFLPHSDDGRYFGASLYYMNSHGDNKIKIVVMSPGYHGVDEDISKENKIEKRWAETICWAESLGFKQSQIVNFRADTTYDTQKIHHADKEKVRWLIGYEDPTMIFIPHIGDTSQSMNYNTRTMVMSSLTRWITEKHKEDNEKKSVLIFEYPTNNVPFIPPSDKNLIIELDASIAEVKHQANKAHESQSKSGFDMTERMVEAVGAVTDADKLHQAHKQRRYTRFMSGVDINPNTSRGEHFGITKIRVKGDTEFRIIEEQVKFPLNSADKKKWTTGD